MALCSQEHRAFIPDILLIGQIVIKNILRLPNRLPTSARREAICIRNKLLLYFLPSPLFPIFLFTCNLSHNPLAPRQSGRDGGRRGGSRKAGSSAVQRPALDCLSSLCLWFSPLCSLHVCRAQCPLCTMETVEWAVRAEGGTVCEALAMVPGTEQAPISRSCSWQCSELERRPLNLQPVCASLGSSTCSSSSVPFREGFSSFGCRDTRVCWLSSSRQPVLPATTSCLKLHAPTDSGAMNSQCLLICCSIFFSPCFFNLLPSHILYNLFTHW